MNRSKLPLKLTVGLVALTTVLAGTVYAAGGHRDRHHGARIFNSLDANEDSALTRDEVDPLVERRVSRFDEDGDGNVTTAEIDASLMRRLERRRERILERYDTDGDGTIASTEIDALVTGMFERADSDDDGEVSAAEARAYRVLVRAEHGHGRRGHRGGWRRHGGWDDHDRGRDEDRDRDRDRDDDGASDDAQQQSE